MEIVNPQPGDWIRFYTDGRLVIGVVQYVRPRSSWQRCDTVCTDVGAISADRILETRTFVEGCVAGMHSEMRRSEA
jgi:hypothetical protein